MLDGATRRETLRTDGKPLPPTPVNVRYAHRLSAEIKDRIRYGTFSYADYFPASPHATSGSSTTAADVLDLWLGAQATLEASTLKGYRTAVEWWKAKVGSKPVKALKHSDILTALASEPGWSGKTRNNKASVLRQALALAVRDGVIKSSPIAELEPAAHQAPTPDPFSLQEVDDILQGLADRHVGHGGQVARYFGFKFFTGLRTSESLPLRWENIDWRQKQLLVADAVVLGEYKQSTKTNSARVVELNSRAMAMLQGQKASTFLQPHGFIFPDPRTGERWTDDEPPRELFWRPTLKRLGIRYRSPYQTRHTYATMMLMAGVAPAYAARQMGHSVEVFLRTYARWIDGGQNAVEQGKLEALLSPTNPGKNPGKNRTNAA